MGEEEVLTHARPAVNLDGSIEHCTCHGWRHDLDHGDQVLRGFSATLIHTLGSFQCEQPRLLDIAGRTRDVLADRLLFRQRATECNAALGTRAHGLERSLRETDQAHAMMDTAR